MKKHISILLIFTILMVSLATPSPVHARISFRKFFRAVGRSARAIGRGSRFIVNLPDRATRRLGPVLGPIASFVLTKNIAKNPRWTKLWQRANRANRAFTTLEERDKYLAEMRKMYQGEAVDLRKKAQVIRDSRKNLLSDLSKSGMTYDEYKKQVIALNDVAEIYEATADKFDQTAKKMRAEDIGRMLSRNVLDQVWVQVRKAVVFETAKELEKAVDPDIVNRLLSRKANWDTVLDALTSAKVKKILGEGDYKDIDTDALKKRVRDRVKEILKENKEAFKKDWKKKVDEIIKNMAKKLEEEKKNLPTVKEDKVEPTKTQKPTGADEGIDSLDELLEFDDDGCKLGYKWDKKLGKCIQENCYDEAIKHAHWSHVGDCVCGSSGSIDESPDDPNKECSYPKDYHSCSGCVYKCVGFDEDCPEP